MSLTTATVQVPSLISKEAFIITKPRTEMTWFLTHAQSVARPEPIAIDRVESTSKGDA